MPGAIPHLLAGCAMCAAGLLAYQNYFTERMREKIYLAVVCLLFSIIPDFFLALYFLFNVSSRQVLLPYHMMLHYAFTPVSLGFLLVLFVVDVPRKPIWIMGCLCILLHVTMDLIIHEGGIWL